MRHTEHHLRIIVVVKRDPNLKCSESIRANRFDSHDVLPANFGTRLRADMPASELFQFFEERAHQTFMAKDEVSDGGGQQASESANGCHPPPFAPPKG